MGQIPTWVYVAAIALGVALLGFDKLRGLFSGLLGGGGHHNDLECAVECAQMFAGRGKPEVAQAILDNLSALVAEVPKK